MFNVWEYEQQRYFNLKLTQVSKHSSVFFGVGSKKTLPFSKQLLSDVKEKWNPKIEPLWELTDVQTSQKLNVVLQFICLNTATHLLNV